MPEETSDTTDSKIRFPISLMTPDSEYDDCLEVPESFEMASPDDECPAVTQTLQDVDEIENRSELVCRFDRQRNTV